MISKRSLVIGSIIIFYLVNNYLWLSKSLQCPFFFYYAFDFSKVMEIYDYLIRSDIAGLLRQFHLDHNTSIHSINAALISIIFGKSILMINMFNIFYFALAVISIYLIGQKIADKKTGLLAAVIFSLYPAVYGISRLYVVEFAVMGMVAFSAWCLLKTEGFSNRKFSLLLGFAVGWGMLLKYSFLGIFIGPLIYVAVNTFKSLVKIQDKREYLTRILNIAYCATLTLLIIGGHYFNFDTFRKYGLRLVWQSNRPWHDSSSLHVSILGLIEEQLSLFFFLIFIFGFFFFFTKTERRAKIVILLWIFIPWAIFILMPHDRMAHYIIPYLPAIALVSAVGWMQFLKTKKLLKIILISLILIIGITQYYDFSFGVGLPLSRLKANICGRDIHYYVVSEGICSPPRKREEYDKIISSIRKRIEGPSEKVLILPDAFFYTNPHVWRCIAWFKDLPYEVSVLEENSRFVVDVLNMLKQADSILYSGSVDIHSPLYIEQILVRSRRCDALHSAGSSSHQKNVREFDYFLKHELQVFKVQFQKEMNNFELVEEIIREDNVGVYLYQRL